MSKYPRYFISEFWDIKYIRIDYPGHAGTIVDEFGSRPTSGWSEERFEKSSLSDDSKVKEISAAELALII